MTFPKCNKKRFIQLDRFSFSTFFLSSFCDPRIAPKFTRFPLTKGRTRQNSDNAEEEPRAFVGKKLTRCASRECCRWRRWISWCEHRLSPCRWRRCRRSKRLDGRSPSREESTPDWRSSYWTMVLLASVDCCWSWRKTSSTSTCPSGGSRTSPALPPISATRSAIFHQFRVD